MSQIEKIHEKNDTHKNICESLELFAETVMPEFISDVVKRENKKAEELAPYIEAALKRKEYMQPLSPTEVPLVKASVKSAKVGAMTNKAAAGAS